MSHWDTQGRLAAEHRSDLDREAAKVSLARSARAAGATETRSALLLRGRTWLAERRRRRLEASLQATRLRLARLEASLAAHVLEQVAERPGR